jgi:hypothetical protein
MRAVFGIPVPRGVQKDWEAVPMAADKAAALLRCFGAPAEWGEPTACVRWEDRFGRTRLHVGHYTNGRSVTVRIDANGNPAARFGDVK